MKYLLTLYFILFSFNALSWGEVGHEVIAQIAWSKLSQADKDKINKLLSLTAPYYAENKSFITAAKWADLIRPTLMGYEAWHYISTPYAIPPYKTNATPDKVNIHYGLCQAVKTVGKSPLVFDKAWMLPMIIHLVADVHQPLHTTSLYSKKFPNGDEGGNLYLITVDKKPVKLHLFWDLGMGILDNIHAPYTPSKSEHEQTKMLAQKIMKEFPESSLKKQVENLNFNDWIKEGHFLATTAAYSIKENQEPTEQYITKGKKIIKKQLALAGYRLAFLLNKVLQKKNLPNLSCQIYDSGNK